jgi:hypothetical protein
VPNIYPCNESMETQNLRYPHPSSSRTCAILSIETFIVFPFFSLFLILFLHPNINPIKVKNNFKFAKIESGKEEERKCDRRRFTRTTAIGKTVDTGLPISTGSLARHVSPSLSSWSERNPCPPPTLKP